MYYSSLWGAWNVKQAGYVYAFGTKRDEILAPLKHEHTLCKKVHQREQLWHPHHYCHPALRPQAHPDHYTDGSCFHFQAFTDTVVERPAQASFAFHPQAPASAISAAAQGQDAGASSRPVSKFRASRQKSDVATLTPSGGAPQGQDDGSSTSTRPISKFRASRQKQDSVRWRLMMDLCCWYTLKDLGR